jgi:hypothetical protein
MILVAVLSQEKKKCIDMKIHKVKTPLPWAQCYKQNRCFAVPTR